VGDLGQRPGKADAQEVHLGGTVLAHSGGAKDDHFGDQVHDHSGGQAKVHFGGNFGNHFGGKPDCMCTVHRGWYFVLSA